ncbi:DUF4405 domain-containing protein [Rhizobium sp. CF142]|uniref:DUF4405 domain-containing protein n=1 Tax=Rhizobium sp. CF142 TaxID=1144314 RepID=UPI00026EF450|nr:DUF4405 domain-containing protein [Rhizobium sp. CF142]EJJ29502.1 hypothetical protein PMI11_02241 [Rhizobium sp. CF142]
MTNLFALRILLDFVAVALLVACLAYWWQDNLIHELLGTALFVLVLAHNVFNRQWLGAPKASDAPRLISTLVIVSTASLMLTMIMTSLLISRDVFAFTAITGAFTIREIHMFAAYWTLLVVSLHLGTRWFAVIAICRKLFGLQGSNRWRKGFLRLLVAGISIWGVRSYSEMAFGSKLMLTYSLDMWDFNEQAMRFFLNYASIVGLHVTLGHYGLCMIRMQKPS